MLDCAGDIGPEVESCDGQDNDCDGQTDETAAGAPITGGACGLCSDGTITCDGGAMVCKNATIPSADVCDNKDNDCNALTPNGSAAAWYGQPCDGPDSDSCQEGSYQCAEISSGNWGQSCSDTTGHTVETCNGLDDDCNGQTDEGLTPPPSTCMSACAGVKSEVCDNSLGWRCDYYCTDEGGDVECDSMGNPVPEETICDNKDNDCDGLIDESFDKQFNPEHCGACDRNCATMGSLWPNNTVPLNWGELGCQSGTCILLSCKPGYVDDRTNAITDCSYQCTPSNGGVEICGTGDNDCDGQTDENATTEICDGKDNDCNGQTDESLNLPPGRCLTGGVCSVVPSIATCGGAAGWNCQYTSITEYQATENLCDGLDNDCDGITDEGFSDYGTACSRGQGGCLRTGTFRCATTKSSTVCCSASTALCDVGNVIPDDGNPPQSESCDGLDNDCDGRTDEGVGAGSTLEYISLSYAGNNYDVFLYEASKPDADAYDTDSDADNDPGVVTTAACSADTKVPWTMVNWTEARAACQALNEPTANCSTSACWDLCPAVLWQNTCEKASGGTYVYPYSNTYNPATCNGHDYSGSWDHLVGAGFASSCIADWPADDVFDLSGNVEEWTWTGRTIGSDMAYEVRGGSYNDLAGGMTCGFDFWAAQATFRMPNLGFRCCRPARVILNNLCAQQLNTAAWNFEGTSGSDWTRQGEWEIGLFNGARVLATDLDDTYNHNQNISATSPIKNISNCSDRTVTLRFRMAFQIEAGSPATNCGYDWGVLEAKVGSSWVPVNTAPIYTDNTNKRWCGSTGGTWPGTPTWVSYTADVSSLMSSAFQFRFRFVSNGTNRFRGMYVDDITLTSP
jgi:hypothetical protein